MKYNFRALFVLVGLLVVSAGCNTIEDMIQDATMQTVSISRTISDTDNERDVQSVTVVDSLLVAGGQALPAGIVSVDKLTERIEAARLGMAEVQFFIKAMLRNNSNQVAFVTLYAIPNADGLGEPMPIGTITLAPFEEREILNAADMGQGSETLHENLKAILFSLGEDYQLNPVIQVQGANSLGVTADYVQLSALPVLWKSDEMTPGALTSYRKNVRRVFDAKLEGTITNYGDNVAEISIHLGTDPDALPEETLLAHTFLSPGETLAGFEIQVPGAGDKIKSAFESMIDGMDLTQDFVIISEDPFKIKCRNLRLHAKLDVEVDIFELTPGNPLPRAEPTGAPPPHLKG